MRAQGTVKWFNTAYGFIEPSGDGPDVFVHSSQVTEMIDEGDTVEYEPDVGPKGRPIATNVKLIKSAPKKTQLEGGMKAESVSRLEENDKPKKKRKKKKTKKGPGRSIIGGENFPLTVPITEISTESKVAELIAHIDTSGPILVTCMKGDGLGPKSASKSLLELQEIVTEKVRKKFPDNSVKLLDWPAIERKGARTSHPYITSLITAAVIVSSPDSDLREDDFQIALVESAYQLIINKSKNKWVILGDETGGLEEFIGKPAQTPAAMCWIVVPPDTKLPPLAQDFHGTESRDKLHIPLKALIKNKSVMCFTFPFEQGTITKGSGLGEDPHLGLWQDTLPLVIEMISNKIKKPVNCDIFIEQVKLLEAGIGVIDAQITTLKSALNQRNNWNNINFEQMWVLAKAPCEHPWIGYPDALGHTLREKPIKGVIESNVDIIRKRTISTPYRQESLSGSIHTALMNTSRPLVFLKGLSSISVEDQWDYIRVFFSEAIREATSNLKAHHWQKLNKHMKESAANEQGQKATQLIIENFDLESALEKMSKPQDRFELFMSMMGTANHMGDTESAFKVSDMIEELREEPTKYEPGRDRLLKYHNLFAGTFDNVFDFDYSIESLNQYLPSELEYEPIKVEREEDAHYLGSKIVALGLRNGPGNVEQAIDISDVVRDYPSGDDAHLARHFIYLAELFMQQERNEDGFDVLRSRIEESCSFSRDENYSNGYYLASMLKASCLTGKGEEEFRYAKDFVIKRLRSDSEGAFPSQRIAYWFTIWAQSLELIDQASEAITYLESMVEKNWKAQNVLGVIISCELLDLKHRGLTEIDAETYLENVLENSHERTRKWVDGHKPSEEDWLAPLNFNYR